MAHRLEDIGEGGGSTAPFADRLCERVEARSSQLVLGLDPDPAALWFEAAGSGSSASAREVAQLTADAVERHCRLAIEAAGPFCVAVKLQFACFERLGGPGIDAAYAVADAAREAGLLVIADAKRGDVPVSAKAYAQAFLGSTPGPFGDVPGFGADALTVNPLLGRDALEPFTAAAAAAGAGLFVLVRTSNPGAADLQDLPAPDRPLHERIAELVASLGAGDDSACGLSMVGAVTGATRPEMLDRLRELMPRAVFLLPGVGAQGGRVEELAAAFRPHPAAGLVTASRSIVSAYKERGGDPARAAAEAAEELRAAAWSLV
ncbi:MAG TPA: orotidine-5'-phosphate decarboxylase [Thermoleophilaceae bacterium]